MFIFSNYCIPFIKRWNYRKSVYYSLIKDCLFLLLEFLYFCNSYINAIMYVKKTSLPSSSYVNVFFYFYCFFPIFSDKNYIIHSIFDQGSVLLWKQFGNKFLPCQGTRKGNSFCLEFYFCSNQNHHFCKSCWLYPNHQMDSVTLDQIQARDSSFFLSSPTRWRLFTKTLFHHYKFLLFHA